MEYRVKNGIPAMGQSFEVELPMHLVNQMHMASLWMKVGVEGIVADKVSAIGAEVVKFLATNYAKACDE
eukprot:8128453-Heterocapsa_arctica.AAC.1